jgi:hypothetical protein
MTNKCTNSYQFIISLCRCYMFRHLMRIDLSGYSPGLHITDHNNILNRFLPTVDPDSHVTQQVEKSFLMMAHRCRNT